MSFFFLHLKGGKLYSSGLLINTVIAPFCLNLIKANFQHLLFKSLKSKFIYIYIYIIYDLLACNSKYISACLSKLILFSTESYISSCILDIMFHVPMCLQHPCSSTGGQVISLTIPSQQILCCHLQCCPPRGLEVVTHHMWPFCEGGRSCSREGVCLRAA